MCIFRMACYASNIGLDPGDKTMNHVDYASALLEFYILVEKRDNTQISK